MAIPSKSQVREVSVLNALTDLDTAAHALARATVTERKAVINGFPYNINIEDVISYERVAYSAGQTLTNDYDLTSITVANSLAYTFIFKKIIPNAPLNIVDQEAVNRREYTFHLADGHTAANVRDELIARINLDPDRLFVASLVGGKCRATGGDATFYFTLEITPADVVTTIIQAYIQPTGTPTFVNEYAAGHSVTGAQYSMYIIRYFKRDRHAAVGGGMPSYESVNVLFADENGTFYSTFNTRFSLMFTTSTLDALIKDGALGLPATTLTDTGSPHTLVGLYSQIFVDATSAPVTINIPDSATLGDRFLYFRRIDNSAEVVTIQTQGADTINGGASITMTGLGTTMLTNAGAGAYWTMEPDIANTGNITITGTLTVTSTSAFGDDILMATDKEITFRDAALTIFSSVDGQLDIQADAELEITSPIINLIAATHVSVDGHVLVSGVNEIRLRDTALLIYSSVDGQLDIDADAEIEITSPIIQLVAATHVAIDAHVLISGVNELRFFDTALLIYSSADGQLDIDADVKLQITAATTQIVAASAIDLDGNILLDGILTFDQTPQTLTGAGAVDITSAITWVVTTGVDALTLVDGAEGQLKYIVMKTDANDGTLTPDSLGNGATITFDDVGDCCMLLFTNAAWHMIGGTATLA